MMELEKLEFERPWYNIVKMYSHMLSVHAYSLGMYDAIHWLVLSTGLQLARATASCVFVLWLAR